MRYWWDFCGGVYSLQERLTKPRRGTEKDIQSVQLRLKNLGFLSLAKKEKKKKLHGDSVPVYNRREDN